MRIERVGDARYELGECPIWDVQEQALWFTDFNAGTIIRHEPVSGERTHWHVACGWLGSMALREGGGAILVMDDGFHSFDFETETATPIVEPEAGENALSFNDCKVDRRGRLIAGSMHRDCEETIGSLCRLDPDLSCKLLDGDFICANGPCWSPDNTVLYVADSYACEIHAYDYDVETGDVCNRRLIVTTSGDDGVPDGLTVDAEGYLWNARFGGGVVVRMSPDGKTDRVIEMPVGWVTSLTFGGPDHDILYVTTSGGEWDGARDTSEHAGCLFAIHDLGVQGLPERRFAG